MMLRYVVLQCIVLYHCMSNYAMSCSGDSQPGGCAGTTAGGQMGAGLSCSRLGVHTCYVQFGCFEFACTFDTVKLCIDYYNFDIAINTNRLLCPCCCMHDQQASRLVCPWAARAAWPEGRSGRLPLNSAEVKFERPPSAQGPHLNTCYVEQMPPKPKVLCKPVIVGL